MARILALGSRVVGLSTAIMLARQGHSVTVFERDGEPVPSSSEQAWHTWERRGVAQFRQPHYLHAAGRHVLDRHLLDLKEALLSAGCVTFDYRTIMPPAITDRAAPQGR